MNKSEIIQFLDEKKINDVFYSDLKDKSYFYDEIIIASGTSSKHIQSVAKLLMQNFKSEVFHVEGLNSDGWILIDFYTTCIHLFTEEMRRFYDLESFFSTKKI